MVCVEKVPRLCQLDVGLQTQTIRSKHFAGGEDLLLVVITQCTLARVRCERRMGIEFVIMVSKHTLRSRMRLLLR